MGYPNKRPFVDKYYNALHADVTVATASAHVAIAAQGMVVSVRSILLGTISGADETMTLYKNGATTGYTFTIAQSGSAAGDADSVDIPVGSVTVQDGDYLHLVSANASTGTIGAAVTYVVRES